MLKTLYFNIGLYVLVGLLCGCIFLILITESGEAVLKVPLLV